MDVSEQKAQLLLDWYIGLQRHIVMTPSFHPLLEKTFPYVPEAYEDLTQAREIFRKLSKFVLQAPDEPIRKLVIEAIADYQKQRLRFEAPTGVFGEAPAETLMHLREKGWVRLPSLPDEVWMPIRDAILKEPTYHYRDAHFERPLSLAEARTSENVAMLATPTLLKIPEIKDLVNNREVIALVAAYLGCVPFLLFPTAWWSFATATEAKNAQLFHFDLDDLKFCKLFIYLTDVDTETGPHVYMESTHTSQFILEAAAKSPDGEEEFLDWYRKELRKPDQEVIDRVGREPLLITGKAGSMFIVDTKGLHKGQLPVADDRLVCQFTYGVTPNLVGHPVEALQPPDTSMPMRERKIYRYMNRMFLA